MFYVLIHKNKHSDLDETYAAVTVFNTINMEKAIHAFYQQYLGQVVVYACECVSKQNCISLANMRDDLKGISYILLEKVSKVYRNI